MHAGPVGWSLIKGNETGLHILFQIKVYEEQTTCGSWKKLLTTPNVNL